MVPSALTTSPAVVDVVVKLALGVSGLIGCGVACLAVAFALRAAIAGRAREQRDGAQPPGETTRASPEHAMVCAETARRPVSARLAAGAEHSGRPTVSTADAPRRIGAITTFAATLESSRRLTVAEEIVALRLARLPAGAWIVERHVLVGARRVPFLVVGIGGVFVVRATDGAWTIDDIDALACAGEALGRQLPDYGGAVHAAICLAFDQVTPRKWHGGVEQRGRGGWVLGIDSLEPWLYRQCVEYGIGGEDLRRLDAAALPRWERRSTRRLPDRRHTG